jgi:hypothetical protein
VSEKNEPKEQRAVQFAEAQGGLQFRTGHRVALIVSDIRGSARKRSGQDAADPAAKGQSNGAAAAPGGKVIGGVFRVGDHALKEATFRLHKDSGEGPLITPETLAGGKTALRWAEDHWVTGDDGRYRFTDLPEGRYFVELFGDAETEP